MRSHLRIVLIASALLAGLNIAAPPAIAGGSFGIHVSGSGFGVSVGLGDWGPYTNSWGNAQWSLDYNASLSGYGEWVWVRDLGKVWRPWVAPGWRPYTHGRWVHTTLGWTWVAYEPWGYIPHHYGSWAFCNFGWVWVPGYSYSCANVVWVRSGGYVGWYARPPWGWSHAARGYRHGYRDGYRDGWYDARYATYVDWYHIASDNVSHYAVTHTVASRGRVQDHAAAPTADEVRRRGGVSVTDAPLSQRTVTMNGRQVTVARPEGVARSIEHHASATAAQALSPAALQRRQPQVRPREPVAVSSTTSRSAARDLPADRQPITGGESRFSGQPVVRNSTTTIATPDRNTRDPVRAPTADRVRRSPESPSPVGSSYDDRSIGRSTAGTRRDVSPSIDSRRDGGSTPSTRGPAPRQSTRSAVQQLSSRGSNTDRPLRQSAAAPTRLTAQPAGGAAVSRPAGGRNPSHDRTAATNGDSGSSSNGSLRRTAPRKEAETEKAEKPARRSQKATKR